MRNPVRPLEASDMIAYLTKTEIDDSPRPWADIRGTRMHQCAMKHQYTTGLAGRHYNSILIGQFFDRAFIQSP